MVNAQSARPSVEERLLVVARTAGALGGSFRRDRVGGLPIHGDMPRLRRDPLEPAADRRKAREIVVARMREMGVGVECDISDGVAVFHEIATVPEVMLHHGERAVARLHPVLEGAM